MFLPRTSTNRRDKGHCKLLTAVDVFAPVGLKFQGQTLTPGSHFEPQLLPRPAVLLENAGSVRITEGRSKYCFRQLRILWRFDFDLFAWVEVLRVTSDDTSWMLDFAHAAQRLLRPVADGSEAGLEARPYVERAVKFLQVELSELTSEAACFALLELDSFIASEIVRRSRSLELVRKPVGSEFVYPRLGAHQGLESGEIRAEYRA